MNDLKLFYIDDTCNGQAQCYGCKQKGIFNVSWCCFLWRYKKDNHFYCYDCKNEIENKLKSI